MRAGTALAMCACLSLALLAGCAGQTDDPDGFLLSDAPRTLGSSDVWRPSLIAAAGPPSSSGLPTWTAQFDAAPTAYDINGDGVDELIVHASDAKVYVFDSLTGHVLAVLPTTYPPAWHGARVLNTVAVDVLVPGEAPSLVITNHAGYVSAWRFDEAESDAQEFVFDRTFERRMDGCHQGPSIDSGATLGDLLGDGRLEIVVQTEEIGFFALHPDGATLWGKCWAGGNSAPVIADLNGDGEQEVIVGSDNGFLAVLSGATGDPQWTFDAAAQGVTPASIVVSPTVADLDGVAPLEILFTARSAPPGDATTYASNHMAIFAVHQDPETYEGTMLWMRQPEWANPLSDTRLIVTDVDDDGDMDIIGMDWNTIGHRPGNWERLGPANVFRLDDQGEDVWVRQMETWWSNQDIAVADLDGDGSLSVLVNGPAGQYDGMWRLSATTGAAEAFLPLAAEWKVARGPQLFDLRHDGDMQLVFPIKPMTDGEELGAILVLDLDTPFAAPWPGYG